jgi:hypothetical protein
LQLFYCSGIESAQFCVESISLAVFFRVKPAKGYRYLQIARSVRHGKTVRQQIIATLGRLDLLQESGQLNRLLRSGLRFARQVKVLDAHAAGQTQRGHPPGHGGDGTTGSLCDRGAHAPQPRSGQMVLRDRSPWQEVSPERVRSKDPAPLKVKDLKVEGRRYVVCLNEEQKRKDAHDRAAILESLQKALQRGDKSLVANQGFRRFLQTQGRGHFAIDQQRVREDAQYDGIFVLRTDTDYDAPTVAHIYKTLWMVEDTFRTAKSILDTRPIYHRCDETIRGHVFCSFLALCLKRELELRLEAKGLEAEWAEIIRGLDHLQQVELLLQGSHFLLRGQMTGHASQALRAAEVAVPPLLQEIA